MSLNNPVSYLLQGILGIDAVLVAVSIVISKRHLTHDVHSPVKLKSRRVAQGRKR